MRFPIGHIAVAALAISELASGALLFRIAAPALAQTTIVVPPSAQQPQVLIAPSAPPPPQVEVVPAAPNGVTASYWQPGHWTWSGTSWVWSGGEYVQPPQPAAIWEPGHWAAQTAGGYAWVDGHWR